MAKNLYCSFLVLSHCRMVLDDSLTFCMMKQRGPYDLHTYTPDLSKHRSKMSLCNWQICCCCSAKSESLPLRVLLSVPGLIGAEKISSLGFVLQLAINFPPLNPSLTGVADRPGWSVCGELNGEPDLEFPMLLLLTFLNPRCSTRPPPLCAPDLGKALVIWLLNW